MWASGQRTTASLAVELALGALLASGCGDRGASSGGTLTVDDADFRGAVGDGALSLTEAILLATGELDMGALGARERARIDGSPGRGRRDEIRFAPGLVVSIRRQEEAVDSILPPLVDPGDSIVGDGARLDGSTMEGRPQPGRIDVTIVTDVSFGTESAAPLLVLAASETTASGLTVDSVPATAIAIAGGTGDGVRGIRVTGNVIRGLGRNTASGGVGAIAGFNADGRSLLEVEIADNQIDDTASGVFLVAGMSVGDGETARANVAGRIAIRRNRITRPLTAIIAYAANATRSGGAEDNLLHDLAVEANEVEENLDVGILISTTQPLGSGATARNVLRSVGVRDNRLIVPSDFGRWNVGLYLSGGQLFYSGSSEDDLLEGLTIERNVVEGHYAGVEVFGGVAERCSDCTVRRSVVRQVVLRDNTWHARRTGILFAAGSAFEAAARVEACEISDVTIEHETVETTDAGTASGIVLAGSIAANLPLGGPFFCSGIRFPGYEEPGTESSALLRDVVVRDSVVRAMSGLVVVGGTMSYTEDTIAGARVTDVAIEGNVIDATTSGIVFSGGVVVGEGRVEECRVEGASATDNRTSAGTAVSALSLDEATAEGAEPTSVRGNRVIPP